MDNPYHTNVKEHEQKMTNAVANAVGWIKQKYSDVQIAGFLVGVFNDRDIREILRRARNEVDRPLS